MRNNLEKFLAVWLCVVIFATSFFMAVNAGANIWNIETVDSSDCGGWSSIILDSNDYPHISYYDGTNRDLKYAKRTGSLWSIETIDSLGWVGEYTSIAVNSNNYPHISYVDYAKGDLKYARWTGSVWSIETVDSADYVGWYTSIALDSNDYPHISYYDMTNSALKYAKWDGSVWNIETVDSAGIVGSYTSIALDRDNYPHISYNDHSNYDLKYARWTGSTWSIETVDSTGSVGKYTSIALDDSGYPHISYSGGGLKYAMWTGSIWSIDTVDFTGSCTSIALNGNDYPHISYTGSNNNLKHAKWTGSGWSIEIVDSTGYFGWGTSIEVDSNNCPHISYFMYQPNGDLKYATLMAPKGPEISVEKEFIPSEITTISQKVVSAINITNIGDVEITSMTIIDEYIENMAPDNSSEVLVTITSDEGEVYAIMPEDLDIVVMENNITISFDLPLWVVPVFWESGTLQFGEGFYYLESIPKNWVVGAQYLLYPITELEIGTYHADAIVTAYSETGASTTETATGTLIVLEPIETAPC